MMRIDPPIMAVLLCIGIVAVTIAIMGALR